MNLGDFANLGQIIGGIAVVISLSYVTFQIRQNTFMASLFFLKRTGPSVWR
jgi:hypothetical protein